MSACPARAMKPDSGSSATIHAFIDSHVVAALRLATSELFGFCLGHASGLLAAMKDRRLRGCRSLDDITVMAVDDVRKAGPSLSNRQGSCERRAAEVRDWIVDFITNQQVGGNPIWQIGKFPGMFFRHIFAPALNIKSGVACRKYMPYQFASQSLHDIRPSRLASPPRAARSSVHCFPLDISSVEYVSRRSPGPGCHPATGLHRISIPHRRSNLFIFGPQLGHGHRRHLRVANRDCSHSTSAGSCFSAKQYAQDDG